MTRTVEEFAGLPLLTGCTAEMAAGEGSIMRWTGWPS